VVTVGTMKLTGFASALAYKPRVGVPPKLPTQPLVFYDIPE